MAALETESPEATRLIPGVPWIRAVLIPALGVFLIAAYWVWKPHQPKSLAQGAVPPLANELQQWLVQPNPRQILAWTEKLDQPLESEIQFVVSDAKAAFQSLTANFLPEREF